VASSCSAEHDTILSCGCPRRSARCPDALDRSSRAHGSGFLPDGTAFLFLRARGADTAGFTWSTRWRAPKRLTPADRAGVFLPAERRHEPIVDRGGCCRGCGHSWRNDSTCAGHCLVNGDHWDGLPRRTANRIARRCRDGRGAVPDRDGSLHQLAWFDRSGRVLGSLGDPTAPSVSAAGADGRTCRRHSNGLVSRLVAAPWPDEPVDVDRPGPHPLWSPDGTQIVFRPIARSQAICTLRRPNRWHAAPCASTRSRRPMAGRRRALLIFHSQARSPTATCVCPRLERRALGVLKRRSAKSLACSL